ncbi:MAG TPA: ADP-ribosylglycohydrolase family protein [Candidatus Obscuribacterales bacterium]
MIIELAIGDAYGAGFEYAPAAMVAAQNNLTSYVQHPRHNIGRGRYTGDTQMTIAVTEILLSEEEWTAHNLAAAFIRCFKRDERPGYAGGFYNFLLSVKDADDFLSRIKPFSDKSGGAMRATTIGAYPDKKRVIELARLQAALTHNTEDGMNAAAAAALAAHYFIYNLGKKEDLPRFIADSLPGDWTTPWEGPVGEKGLMSVRAAMTAISGADLLSEILRRSVAFTGDVDTVAAIALGVASNSREVYNDLPAALISGLENGPYGRDFLLDLDARLSAFISDKRRQRK